jgi:hypothetical protein
MKSYKARSKAETQAWARRIALIASAQRRERLKPSLQQRYTRWDTREAMKAGAAIIVQSALQAGQWGGRKSSDVAGPPKGTLPDGPILWMRLGFG